MTEPREWARLPSRWIKGGGLKNFKWRGEGEGSSNVAALMLLLVIAHHADSSGVAVLTYDHLSQLLGGLSRAKISAGLRVLEGNQLIERLEISRSAYRLKDYDASPGWCKIPSKLCYGAGQFTALSNFRLRSAAELHALMLYLLFAERRTVEINIAMISYDKIMEFTGIGRGHIRKALDLLVLNDLVHTYPVPSGKFEGGVAHGYRLCHLDSYRHSGTTGHRTDIHIVNDRNGEELESIL